MSKLNMCPSKNPFPGVQAWYNYCPVYITRGGQLRTKVDRKGIQEG